MDFIYEAVCGCVTGPVRLNNEDNLYFAGHILREENNGLPQIISQVFGGSTVCFAVFDGMGGIADGQIASAVAAASFLQDVQSVEENGMLSESFFTNAVNHMNSKVLARADMIHNRMGTTVAAAGFCDHRVYVMNVGDSRVYRLRDGQLRQLSVDHVATLPPFLKGSRRRKAGLTQCIGVSQDELLLEPYIVSGEVRQDDLYLICTDGLTDMAGNDLIRQVLLAGQPLEARTSMLIETALAGGGKDNITVILVQAKFQQ